MKNANNKQSVVPFAEAPNAEVFSVLCDKCLVKINNIKIHAVTVRLQMFLLRESCKEQAVQIEGEDKITQLCSGVILLLPCMSSSSASSSLW